MVTRLMYMQYRTSGGHTIDVHAVLDLWWSCMLYMSAVQADLYLVGR